MTYTVCVKNGDQSMSAEAGALPISITFQNGVTVEGRLLRSLQSGRTGGALFLAQFPARLTPRPKSPLATRPKSPRASFANDDPISRARDRSVVAMAAGARSPDKAPSGRARLNRTKTTERAIPSDRTMSCERVRTNDRTKETERATT